LKLKTTIVDQLVDIYLNKELWHKTKLSPEIAKEFYEKLYNNGNIIVELDGDKVVGYIEVWSLKYDDAVKILDDKPFHAMDEDISSGDYCYIASIYIDKEYRKKARNMVLTLKKKAEKMNPQCSVVIINEQKRGGRYRFYKRGDKSFKGASNG
jgi:hypothetical protein